MGRKQKCEYCNDTGNILTRRGSLMNIYKRCDECESWRKDPYWVEHEKQKKNQTKEG